MEKVLNTPTLKATIKANADKEWRKMVDAIAAIDQLKKDCKSMGTRPLQGQSGWS
jgi:RNA processing factor Prp31